MPNPQRCLNCGQQLRIADDADESWLTCPGCLALIANPRRSAIMTGPGTQASGEPVPVPPQCPRCGQRVEPSWRYCPHCNANCRPARRAPSRPAPDIDVRRDTKATRIILAVFGALALVGVITFAAAGGFSLVGSSPQGPGILLFGLILLAVIGGGTIALLVRSKDPTTKALSGALGGVAIVLSVILMVLLLVVFAVIAVFVSIMETCAKCGRPS